tara:strand:+ start:1559 stop:1897 length:339 start_codon:yes stop_codon:yes gene_type:complete
MPLPSKLIAICAASTLLTSCASTSIYPTGKNTYSSVTTSSEQGYAEKDALAKAEEKCTKQGRKLAVLNHHTEYHGVDAQTKLVGGIAAGLLGGPNYTTSSNDYEVKMNFRCA